MKRQVSFGGRPVGDGQPTYIIAEVGINHNGDMEIAKQIIDAAVHAGHEVQERALPAPAGPHQGGECLGYDFQAHVGERRDADAGTVVGLRDIDETDHCRISLPAMLTGWAQSVNKKGGPPPRVRASRQIPS